VRILVPSIHYILITLCVHIIVSIIFFFTLLHAIWRLLTPPFPPIILLRKNISLQMDEYLKFKRLKIKKNCHLSTSDKIINYNPSLLKQMYIINTHLPQKNMHWSHVKWSNIQPFDECCFFLWRRESVLVCNTLICNSDICCFIEELTL
jgi:hypothetical protein